jgi:hypothetical protein
MMQKHAACRWMGVVAMLGLAFFFIVSLVLQFARPDLDWYTAPISFYLLGPYSTWLIAAYFALAAAILCVAVGSYLALEPPARLVLPLMLFVIGAVCVCIVALAHTDTPHTPRPNPIGVIHNLAALLAFLTVCMAMLLQSWSFRQATVWRAYFIKAFGLAAAAFITLVCYGLWKELPRGASEKTVILLIVLWLMLVSRWLTRLPPDA